MSQYQAQAAHPFEGMLQPEPILEMMKAKKFWKALQKYTRVCLRLVHFAGGEKHAPTGYEMTAAKVALKIMKAAQHSDRETPPRANEINGQGVFTVLEIRRVLNHLKTLLDECIYMTKIQPTMI